MTSSPIHPASTWLLRLSLAGVVLGVVGLCGLMIPFVLDARSGSGGPSSYLLCLLLVLGSVISLLNAQMLLRNRWMPFAWVNTGVLWIGVMLLGFVVISTAQPRGTQSEWVQLLARLGGTLTLLAFLGALAGYFLTDAAISKNFRIAAGALLALTGFCAFFWLTIIWGNEAFFDRWTAYFDVVIPVMLLISTADIITLASLPSIVRLHKQRRPPEESLGTTRALLTFNCPKCAFEMTHPPGFARCGQCAFIMEIDVEEPRCECGYPLFQLVSDRCPECGRELPEDQRLHHVNAPPTIEEATP